MANRNNSGGIKVQAQNLLFTQCPEDSDFCDAQELSISNQGDPLNTVSLNGRIDNNGTCVSGAIGLDQISNALVTNLTQSLGLEIDSFDAVAIDSDTAVINLVQGDDTFALNVTGSGIEFSGSGSQLDPFEISIASDGTLFSVSQGDDNNPDNATENVDVAFGDSLHFYSSEGTIDVGVSNGSALVDLNIDLSGLTEIDDSILDSAVSVGFPLNVDGESVTISLEDLISFDPFDNLTNAVLAYSNTSDLISDNDLVEGNIASLTSGAQYRITSGPAGLDDLTLQNGLVAELVKNREIQDTVIDMLSLTDFTDKEHITTLGFFAAGDNGSGEFYYDASCPKSSHDGVNIFDPDNSADLNVWDASEQVMHFTASGTGTGCLVRLNQKEIRLAQVGARTDIDNTFIIQSTIDADVTIIVADAMYDHTFNEIGEGQTFKGLGISSGTGLRQLDGLTYNDGSGPTGSYGLSTKTGITRCEIKDMEYDGNYTASTDFATNYDNIFDNTGNDIVGRIRQANIAITSLNRPSWVAPDEVVVENVYSHDATRNCLIDQGSKIVKWIDCVGENSVLDHIFYNDLSKQGQVVNLTCKGFASNGMVVSSGSSYNNILFMDLTENPVFNAANNFDFQTRVLWDDRTDVDGSTLTNITVLGDLQAINTVDVPIVFNIRSRGSVWNAIDVQHTGADDTEVYIFVTQGTQGAPSTIRGFNVDGVVCREMPSLMRFYSHDPSNFGGTLLGGNINKVDIYYSDEGNQQQTIPLFEFRGVFVRGFNASNLFIDSQTFGVNGAGYLFDASDVTNNFQDVSFSNMSCPSFNNTAPSAWEVPSIAQDITVSEFSSRCNAPIPSTDNNDLVCFEKCRFFQGISEQRISAAFTGDGTTNAFTIPHNMARTPSWVNAQLVSGSPALDQYRVQSFGSQFTVTFNNTPAAGANVQLSLQSGMSIA